MKSAGALKTEKQRCVLLGFDEVKAEEKLEYDKGNDVLVGPVKQIQVLQVRGLFEDYKQVIYSDFDVNVTKALLDEVAVGLHNIGFHLCGIVSDLGGPNQKLHNELEVSPSKPYYKHPTSGKNIYVLACTPHMLKLFRNHFIDHGFSLEDGSIVTKDIIQKLLQFSRKSDQLNAMFHLKQSHLTVDPTSRQHVRTAAELLSQKTAIGLRRYCEQLAQGDEETKLEALRVANVVETVSYMINNSIIIIKPNY